MKKNKKNMSDRYVVERNVVDLTLNFGKSFKWDQ